MSQVSQLPPFMLNIDDYILLRLFQVGNSGAIIIILFIDRLGVTAMYSMIVGSFYSRHRHDGCQRRMLVAYKWTQWWWCWWWWCQCFACTPPFFLCQRLLRLATEMRWFKNDIMKKFIDETNTHHIFHSLSFVATLMWSILCALRVLCTVCSTVYMCRM